MNNYVTRIMCAEELWKFINSEPLTNYTRFDLLLEKSSTSKGFCFFPGVIMGVANNENQQKRLYHYNNIMDLVSILEVSGVINADRFREWSKPLFAVKFKVKKPSDFIKSRGRYCTVESWHAYERGDVSWDNIEGFWALEYCTPRYSKETLQIESVIDINLKESDKEIFGVAVRGRLIPLTNLLDHLNEMKRDWED